LDLDIFTQGSDPKGEYMKLRKWSSEIEIYELNEEYSIHKAQWKEFSVHFATYVVGAENVWFRQSFEVSCSVLKECDNCFYIEKQGTRIGGVLMEPNYICCLFLQPPYGGEYYKVLVLLKKLLVHWSDNSKNIEASSVKPGELKHYLRLGFRQEESRRCMIRPTETFNISFEDNYEALALSKSHITKIATLFSKAFADGVGEDAGLSKTEHEEAIMAYFKENSGEEILKRASTLLYDKETKELIGVCLISLWEGWPNIYDIAVKPSYGGKGLASMMIKKALNVLKEEYPVLRLFVTLGNSAEAVYYNLGFLPGVETSKLYIPAQEN
jgi:ribosomal protein S18 acetylase RimI-like enzyme